MTEDREYWNDKMDLNLYKLCSRGKEFVESCGLPYDIVCDNAIDFTDKELELIEQYAATRGIKKATAVKELCIRGLELTTKPKIELTLRDKVNQLLGNLDLNRSLFSIGQLLDNHKYSEALEILHYIQEHSDPKDTNRLNALNKTIILVEFYDKENIK